MHQLFIDFKKAYDSIRREFLYNILIEFDEVTGEWRKLHNELNDLYCSPNIVRVIKSRMRWVEHVAHMGEGRGRYRVLVGKPEGKRPLRRPRRIWEDNIKMDLQEWVVGVWAGSSWLRIGTGGGHL